MKYSVGLSRDFYDGAIPDNIKVSIITPCLNSERTIRNTIESILRQSYQNVEYIIVDGESTDQTIEIIEEYVPVFEGRLRYVSEKDHGIYDAMNKGILQATGAIVGIINSDDWYEPEALERAVQCFQDTGADVVYGEIWMVDENGRREYHTSHSVFPLHPSTFIRREIYQKYGMFDTAYKIAADRDFLLRLMTENAKIVRVDRILADFRITGISNTRSILCAREAHEINLKYLGKCPGNYLNKVDIEESYDWVKLLYVSHNRPQIIREALSRSCELSEGVIIFGVGNCGGELQTVLERCDIPVLFFVDNDERKWGLERQGVKIYSPEILRYCNGHVIVTISKHEEGICSQIERYANPLLSWSILRQLRESILEGCDDLFLE